MSVRASGLTGRILVDYAPDLTALEDIVDTILEHTSGVELPPEPLLRQEVDPLDRRPLIQGFTRGVGASIALLALAARQAFGRTGPPISQSWPGVLADTISILRGLPEFRQGLRQVLSPPVADTLLSNVDIVAKGLSGRQLGLVVSLVEAARLLSALLPWRQRWQQFEQHVTERPVPRPGMHWQVRAGDPVPLPGQVVDGWGIVLDAAGQLQQATPGGRLHAGDTVLSGTVEILLEESPAVPLDPHPPILQRGLVDTYLRMITPLAFGYALFTAVRTRSFRLAARALVLVNARTALIGQEGADAGALARLLRLGGLAVRLRPTQRLRLPTLVVLDHPALLVDGLEVDSALPLVPDLTADELRALALAVATRTATSWALPLLGGHSRSASLVMLAEASRALYNRNALDLAIVPRSALPLSALPNPNVDLVLVLRDTATDHLLGLFPLRPRLAGELLQLQATARRLGVRLAIWAEKQPVSAWLTTLDGLELLVGESLPGLIRQYQRQGAIIAWVTSHAASPARQTADLAVGFLPRHSMPDIAVDVLVPNLRALTELLDTTARRDRAVRDSVLLAIGTNILSLGAGLGSGILASQLETILAGGALLALVIGWARLWGGPREVAPLTYLDPEPERWGDLPIELVMQQFQTRPSGLTTAEALARRRAPAPTGELAPVARALLEQLSSPLIGVMAAGAALSLAVGATLDVLFIVGTIAVNTLLGAWQEYRVMHSAAMLHRLRSPIARVLRDGVETLVPAEELVPGDVLLLAFGDRVAADARLLSAEHLLVDEASLTGESLPVLKDAHGHGAEAIVLAGSDVLSGRGTAIVVAVGEQTRIGATQRALANDDVADHLGQRLAQFTRLSLPVSFGIATLVTALGIWRGAPARTQLALGASLAIAAVPEGLPLLSRISQAAVARRLAQQGLLVRQLSAIEALGRVDVLCVDKTGTLTQGKLHVTQIATAGGIEPFSPSLSPASRAVLEAAALASPSTADPRALVHSTDAAILAAARQAGLEAALRQPREDEAPFDVTNAFHAARVNGRVVVKGSPEVLLDRCQARMVDGVPQPLDDQSREALEAEATALARQGLRVLLVAEGPSDTSVLAPERLIYLGMIGIADPLRPTARAAIARCQTAGIRVLVITGDHPATAQAIARELGLADNGEPALIAAELRALSDAAIADRLETAAVIARAAPLDKLRIVRALQSRRHVVAMTGDGVNDAPALRLADVGIAMGWGTEVARQAADLILQRDDFALLIEGLIEGRGFWRNLRRATALLIGGNLGEMGAIAGPLLVGAPAPLNTRQILAVNLITDAPPALAIALQEPEHRRLRELAREGEQAFDRPLQLDILRRGVVTATPAVLAYLWALGRGQVQAASSVAFASIVGGQLAQTLEYGLANQQLSPSIAIGVGTSAACLILAFVIPPVRGFLGLAAPSLETLLVVALASIGAASLSRVLAQSRLPALPLARSTTPGLPAPID